MLIRSHFFLTCAACLGLASTLQAADADLDGLDDSVETGTGIYVSPTNTGTNPMAADSDSDGAGDWYEVHASFTNPNNAGSRPNIPYPLPTPDASTGNPGKPVKVFILSGQSNMLGQGNIYPQGTPGTLETVVRNDRKFPHLLSGVNWAAREDVRYRGVIAGLANDKLGIGQGSGVTAIGPELSFGHVMGYYFDEPVLVLKSSEGGKSLGGDYLPPGSQRYTSGSNTVAGFGDSPAAWLTGSTPVPSSTFYGGIQFDKCFRHEADWAPAGAGQPAAFNVVDVLDNFATEYPQWEAQGFEIAGFCWFQGYNDIVGGNDYPARYQQNMERFIVKVREYYEARYPGKIKPKAPFVIASCGFDGYAQSTNAATVTNAQLAMANPTLYPDFAGNVKTMDSRGYWRDIASSPLDQGYHYNRNAETFLLVGDALGRGMIDLINAATPDTTAPGLLTATPSDNASGVLNNANFVLTFTEPILRGTGAVTLKNLGSGAETIISVNDPQVSISGSVLTINPAVNLAYSANYAVLIDGAAFQDLAGNFFAGISDQSVLNFATAAEDLTAPTPNPMTFATPPSALSNVSITMTASTATDVSGVEYFFECLTAGGHSSGWLDSPTYIDTGLLPGNSYAYRAKARDKSANQNETMFSGSFSVATLTIPPVLVYEPFDYSASALNGAAGTTEKGFSGAWTANSSSLLSANLAFGNLVTRGGAVSSTDSNSFGGARTLDPSAFGVDGLLNDGATLWFSVLVGYGPGGNLTNSRLGIALANNRFVAANGTYNIADTVSDPGSGLGITLGRFSGINGKIVATQFTNSGSGFAGNVFGTETPSPIVTASGQYALIVGKITWGATTDTIELYRPGADLVLPAVPISTLSVNVNQANFNTLTYTFGGPMLVDEIRFGASYASVIETGSYWDVNGAVSGAGGATPVAAWDASALWNPDPAGTGIPAPWIAGSTAVFAAGADATGIYSIGLNLPQDIGGLSFEEGNVSLSGSAALRMTSNSTVAVANGLTATLAAPLSQDATPRLFTKSGPGRLILSGNNAAATGGMNLTGGHTQFANPAALNGSARNINVGSAGAVSFGPDFGAENIPTALLARITASSSGTIAADDQENANFDLNAAGLNAAYFGAIGAVNYAGTLTPHGTVYRLGGGGGTLTMANVNALTGARSFIVNGSVELAAGNNFTGSTTINALVQLAVLGPTTTSGVTLNAPGATLILGHNNALGSNPLTLAGSFSGVSTLRAQGTVTIPNAVTVNSGGFFIDGVGTLTLGGTMTLNNTVTITNNNVTNLTTLGPVTGTNRALTFSGNGNTHLTAAITTGTGTLSKNGTGVLTLSAANSYTGVTSASGGVLRLNHDNALPGGIGASGGTSALTFNGGVLGLGSGDFSRGLGSGVTQVLFTGNGGWAAYGADRLVNLGGAGASIPWATATTGFNAKVVILSAASATHAITLQNAIDLGTAARTLQVDDGLAAIDAVLSGNLTGAAGGNLSKTGAGALILAGSNSHVGTTTISAGKCFINGNSSAATGTVSVSANATLGGTGVIGGGVTIAASGRLEFNLSSAPASHDKLELTTGKVLTFSGASTLTITSSGGVSTGTYTLVTAPGGISGNVPATLILPAGWVATVAKSGTDLVLNVTSIGAPTFADWLTTNSTAGSFGADHDGDGVPNGVEFFLGGNSNTTGYTALPGVVSAGGAWTVTWVKSADFVGNYGAQFVVETSSDLAQGWTAEPLGVNVTLTGQILTYTFPSPSGGVRFVRLRVN